MLHRKLSELERSDYSCSNRKKNQCMGLEVEIQENVPHFSFYGTLFKTLIKKSFNDAGMGKQWKSRNSVKNQLNAVCRWMFSVTCQIPVNQVEVGSIIPHLNKQFGSNVYKVNKHRLKKCLIRILLSFIPEKLKHIHWVISYSSRYPTHSSFINMLCFANILPIVDNCLFFSQFMPTTIKFVLIRRNTCQADRIDAIAYLLCTWKHLWLHTQCFDWIMSFYSIG